MSFCDIKTGTCAPEAPANEPIIDHDLTQTESVNQLFAEILYATDPICSHCWALEPAWRKLLYHYGANVKFRHVYGGLLPGWQGFQDAGAGIRKPADVAPHWAEVAQHYGQPIDPSVWLTDPLDSSYPPSIAVHAVRMLAPEHEETFLRRIREALFLEAKNIACFELLAEYAQALGIDGQQFTTLYQSGVAEACFRRDLAEVRQLGVLGFPTLIIQANAGKRAVLHGSQPYARLEQALLQVTGLEPATQTPTPEQALKAYQSGTTKEFAELLNRSHAATAEALTAIGAKRRAIAGDAFWSIA